MPGKRKRVGHVALGSHVASRALLSFIFARTEFDQRPGTPAANEKPRSAIAAARLKAEAAAKSIGTPEATIEAVLPPRDVVPPSPAYGHEESESEEEEPAIIKQNLKLCSWRNDPRDILLNTDLDLTVQINKHTTISILGCFRFKVLRGAVNINGANIGALSREGQKDQQYTACVPATHAITKIRGLDSINHVQFTHCSNARPLANISSLFEGVWNSPVEAAKYRSFQVVTESDSDILARPLRPECIPEDWLRAVEECAINPSTVVAIGAPATGKSTFLRRLLNRYLTGQGKSARSLPAICYLDLDVSQPEYTPHGQISLCMIRSLNLGPNFTHPVTSTLRSEPNGNEIVRSHAVPTNLANYGDHYQACVEDLIQSYRVLQSVNPALALVVNSPGSLYATDFDLLINILGRLKPHHAVHIGNISAIDTDNATKLHALQTNISQYRGTMHEITAQSPSLIPMRTDAELRAMHMQSYFHSTTPKFNESEITSYISKPLSTFLPWQLCFSETSCRTQAFVGFAFYSEPFEPASLIHALNGAVLQIVDSTSSVIPTPYTSLPRTHDHGIPYFERNVNTGRVDSLDSRTSKLICSALVCGFDAEKKVFDVIVPKACEEAIYGLVPERTVLVGGCCEVPEWAFLEDRDLFMDMNDGSNMVDGRVVAEVPWVERKGVADGMGYLNTARRVRKFQT